MNNLYTDMQNLYNNSSTNMAQPDTNTKPYILSEKEMTEIGKSLFRSLEIFKKVRPIVRWDSYENEIITFNDSLRIIESKLGCKIEREQK